MKLSRIIPLVTISLLIATSCSLFKENEATPPPSSIAMRFDYVPPTEGVVKSNEIKFALIKPKYVPSFVGQLQDPYKTFVSNMGADFVEMLSARGYPYIGPYESVDEMVYSDKKSTDLILQVVVDPVVTGNPLKYTTSMDYTTKQTVYTYFYDGELTFSGKVNLQLSEPFTGTKVWVKSVPIEPTTFYVKSHYKYKGKDIPVTDPGVWNAVVENMELIYDKALKTSWNHLDPQELKVKKAEAAEIKKNSGFLKN